MRVYVSVDMEGIAGVSHPRPTGRGDDAYPEKVALMVGETNAAIEGALAAGATDILVNDSHGSMHNLPPADLHPAARLLQGQKPWSMVAGAGGERLTRGRAGIEDEDTAAADTPDVDLGDGPAPSFDVALFVGYHARGGHPRGTIAHTFSYAPTLTALDGRPTGEYGLNAAVLGEWGIPVGLVAGDDALADEVAAWLPWAERVVVKEGTGGNSAASLHPSRARELIRGGAERAVRRAAAGELSPLIVRRPVVLEVDFARAVMADHAAIVPGIERVGDRGIRIVAATMTEGYRSFLAAFRLAGIVE